MLRKEESIYYPPIKRHQSSWDSTANPPKAPPTIGAITKGVEQAKDTTNARKVNREAVEGSELPPLAPRDLQGRRNFLKYAAGIGDPYHTFERGS